MKFILPGLVGLNEKALCYVSTGFWEGVGEGRGLGGWLDD